MDEFERIYSSYYRVVRSFFSKRVPAEDVLDLTQETFLGIYRGMATYREQQRLGPWIFQIAKNGLRKHRRWNEAAKRSGDEYSLDDAGATALEAETVETAADPEQEVLDRERSAILQRAIAGLPPTQFRSLNLWLEGCSTREIAELLQISPETAKSHLYRARKWLRKLIEELGMLDPDPDPPPKGTPMSSNPGSASEGPPRGGDAALSDGVLPIDVPSSLANELTRRARANAGAAPSDDELFAYLEGSLTPEDVDRVQRHLVASAETRDRLHEIQGFLDPGRLAGARDAENGSGEAPGSSNPQTIDFEERASWRDLQHRLKSESDERPGPWLRYSGLAALVVLALLGPWIWQREVAPSPSQQLPALSALPGLEIVDATRS
ncbi:MAG: sigma-70 family RNA polymerase sigma factor, partial [Acidobacteriota bacterium]